MNNLPTMDIGHVEDEEVLCKQIKSMILSVMCPCFDLTDILIRLCLQIYSTIAASGLR